MTAQHPLHAAACPCTACCPPPPSRRQALQAMVAATLLGSTAVARAQAQAQTQAQAQAQPQPHAQAQPQVHADASTEPGECVAPSKPGGGFGLTCGLAAAAVQAVRPARVPLPTRYLPGGIGAVAFDQVATGRLGGPGTLVAFSSGSLLNIAQGRFGPHPVSALRFIATLGTDYGVIAVHRDAPYQNLAQVVAALKRDSARVVFGAGGTIGSQDWIKAAQLVRAAGQDHKKMRFVAFEGGGEALKALKGGHLDIFTGDAAEAMQAAAQGLPLRFLAVLAPERLQGTLAGLPTAREQGVDLVWPTVRGLYMAATAPEAAVRAWTSAFEAAMAAPGYAALCNRFGLYPFALTGAALDGFVQRSLQDYRRMAQDLGLRTWPR